jgi:hypothetical protein
MEHPPGININNSSSSSNGRLLAVDPSLHWIPTTVEEVVVNPLG